MEQVIQDGKIAVWKFLGQGFDCNVWIVEGGEESSLLIDSGLGISLGAIYGSKGSSREIVQHAVRDHRIKKCVLTHGHIDHVGGILANKEMQGNLEIAMSGKEAHHLREGDGKYIDPVYGRAYGNLDVNITLKAGDTISLGELSFKVLITPGHTHGSLCLYEEDKKWLFSGDTVFTNGSMGRVDLPTGSNTEMVDSLEKLSSLDLRFLFPGHMNPALGDASNHIQLAFRYAKNFFL